MIASILNKRIYKERRKRPKKVSLFSTNMIKTVIKLYLCIENKELSFIYRSLIFVVAHRSFFYSMRSVFNLFKFIIKYAVLGALQSVCGKREF